MADATQTLPFRPSQHMSSGFVETSNAESAVAAPRPRKDKKKKKMTTKRSFPYFDDGNLVISAKSESQDRFLFRVHKSILSFHSPVFADMFALPTPADVTNIDSYDGVPLLHMPDPADEVASLLKFMYNLKSFADRRHEPWLPWRARPIMELCKKYEIDGLLDHLKSRIESAWPKTLVEWDALEAEIAHYNDTRGIGDDIVDNQYPEPAMAIMVATQFELDAVLPVAFYHLSRLDTEMDRKYYSEVDDDAFLYRITDGERSANWGCLGADELLTLTRGRERLKSMYYWISRHLDNPAFRCSSDKDTQCSKILSKMRKDFQGQGSQRGDLLEHLKTGFSSTTLEGSGLCFRCTRRLEEEVKEMREILWDDLRGVFFDERFKCEWR
ncbi:hypothetical protein JAAARDRAFT_193703 [Jaapia argillacea MUCL 33604]|uniref:BTB domain-containing protein n=1 Tax=Jaapia argillacea MUCL 33604 TaxID=933084 RepID=A0A067PU66_9AGAM|nr:hypothetical protein JAAARDRAFT_193703 [Jaapia argillacea MUCL 33604]